MNEVTKLYENANLISYYCGDDYIFDAMLEVECTNGDKEKCKTCDKAKTNYPPFTAEKLINLEMFLINKGDFGIKKGRVDITFESFTSCIAGLINDLWQDLTTEEKQQIKEILE